MPDCDYCDQSFSDEDALLEHMGEAHEGELGRIDQRRVEEHYGGDDDGLSTTVGYAVVGIVIVAIVGGAVYAAVGAFSGGPPEPIHEHGAIEMTVDNETVNFDQPQYHSPQDSPHQDFHFHRGQGSTWHMHPDPPERFTLAEAMAILDIELTEDSVTYQGETYSEDDPGTTVEIRVDGEPVDPESYELQGADAAANGDQVEIVVETEN